ncbi:hypothetical protein L0F63_005260 [Massospora cicadina]|nr:hypothetical protein L0F63_005260 [Massospora cicadina]
MFASPGHISECDKLQESQTDLTHKVDELNCRIAEQTQENQNLQLGKQRHGPLAPDCDPSGACGGASGAPEGGGFPPGLPAPTRPGRLDADAARRLQRPEELYQQNLTLAQELRELAARSEAETHQKSQRIAQLEATLNEEAQPVIDDLKAIVTANFQTLAALKAENEVLRELAQVEAEAGLAQLSEIAEARATGKDFNSPMFVRMVEQRLAAERERGDSLQNEIGCLKEMAQQAKASSEMQLAELKATINALQGSLKVEAEVNEQLKLDLQLAERRQSALKMELVSTREKCDKLQVSVESHKAEVDQLTQAHKSTLEQLSVVKVAEEQHLQMCDKEHLTAKLVEADEQLSNLQAFRKADREQFDLERRTLSSRINELQDHILSQDIRHEQALQSHLQKFETTTQLSEMSTAKAQLEKSSESVGSGEQIVKALGLKLNAAQAEVEELRKNELQRRSIAQAAEAALQSSLQESQDLKAQLNREISQLRAQLEQMEAQSGLELAAAKTQIAQLQVAVAQLHSEKEQLNQEIGAIHALHNEARANLQSLQDEWAKLREHTTKCAALEAALVKSQETFKDDLEASKDILELKMAVELLPGKTPDLQGLITFLRWERDNVEEQLWGCHISNQRLRVEVDVASGPLQTQEAAGSEQCQRALQDYERQLQMLLETNSQLEAENLQLAEQQASTKTQFETIFDLKEWEVVMLQEANLHLNLQIQKLSEWLVVTEGLALVQSCLKELPTMQMELESLRVKFKMVYAIVQKLKASEATQSSTITSLEDDIKSTKLSLARVAQVLSVEASEANILHAIQPAQPSPLAQAGGDAWEDVNYESEGDLGSLTRWLCSAPSSPWCSNPPSPIIVDQDGNV